MKNRRTTRIAIAAALALPLVTSARELTLAGSSDATWNTDAANTTWNVNGSPTAFANGDDTTIGSTFTGSKITFGARVTPGDVVFDIGRTLTLDFGSANTYGLGINTKSFTKRGSGTLLMTHSVNTTLTNGDERFGNAVTAGVEIVEGEIALKDPNVHHYFGPRTIPHWVHVRNGASLTFLARNQTGAYDNNECGFCVELDSGARLNHGTNNLAQSDYRPLALHTLKLSGGDITNGVNAWRNDANVLGGVCSMYLFNTLWFSGSMPHAFGFESGYDGCKRYAKGATIGGAVTISGSKYGRYISLNTRQPVEFRVDDITGDSGVDAYINPDMFTWGKNSAGVFKADIVKTGAGTLSVPVAKSASTTKDFLGDITVAEGTLELAAQKIFPFSTAPYDATAAQTLTVSNGATVAFSIRNVVNGDTVSGDAITVPRLRLVVDGGTFKYHATGDNSGCNRFRECVFHDATIDIRNPGRNEFAGILAFMGPVSFSGSTPYVLDVNTDVDNKSQAIACYNDPRTTFDVADITGNGAADVTLGLPLYNYATNNSARGILEGCGFVKTGAGTLRLTYTFANEQKSLNGPVDVSNGVLRVDGRLTGPSMLTVAAGGFLGGTGMVNRVTLEPGAGLAALAGQTEPLHVQKSLALPATGVIAVSNPDGLDLNSLRTIPVLTAATDGNGSLTGTENLVNWTVSVDGVHNGSWTLFADGNTVKARRTLATVISIR